MSDGQRIEYEEVFKKKRRRKNSTFNPNSEYIQNAVAEYLACGGKITRIEMDASTYDEFIKMRDTTTPPADEFLNGDL